MLLKDWLQKEGIKAYAFAIKIGVAPPTLYRSMGGKQRLSARYGVKIEAETNGEVSRCEAIWPEDYVDKDDKGGEQMRAVPKIHNEE